MNARLVMTVGLAAVLLLFSCTATEPRVQTGGIDAIGLGKPDDIRVVYQIKTDDMKDGVGAGLHYVKKLLDTYNAIGIRDDAVDVHAVFHGDAGHWMLKDEAYAEAAEGTNPNKAIIAELHRRGVSLELCAQSMRGNGWKPSDVLPDVEIVVGAYPRIIDLQQRGHVYIRF